MVVLTSFQAVQVHNQAAAIKCGYHPRLRLKNGTVSIRCGIAEPSGEPAPFGQKTKYKDGFFEKAFMTLFARKMEKFAAKSNKDGTPVEKKGWFDYDYESFVDVSKRVIQGRNRTQQQQVVREVLLSMLPPGAPAQFRKLFPPTRWACEFNATITVPFFDWLVGPSEVVEVEVNGVKQRSGVRIKKCRYLENSGCVGMCVNMCKIPTQDFFTDEFGLPLTMTPNFEDMSCEMVYGQAPPPFEDDPASKQPCFADICKRQLLKALWQIPIRASVPSCKPNRNSSYFISSGSVGGRDYGATFKSNRKRSNSQELFV
ncbi:beta-carotene isomerase D27, chloroplastic isoform X1 [Coffea eugenioides]|uniref:Beta-carotene isomerase D27, chloroplastic isoform X1 n=1 Tax=Coffea arabica TaxID=13443 RepID=A0A6P6TU19_COFAR|nr:beta-carotene isomerase D27, chloroplastic isoform X1 [Coffea eugenioides]